MRLEISGVGIEIDADAVFFPTLDVLYAGFAEPARVDACIRATEDGCEFASRDGALSGRVRAARPGHVPALLAFLLGRIVEHFRPGMLLLHGNVIARRSGGAVLLLGHSGSGKSTLTRELVRAGSGWLHGEDWVLIDPAAGRIDPFPRAGSQRLAGGMGVGEVGLPTWVDSAGGGGAKLLVPFEAPEGGLAPLPIDGMAVAFLARERRAATGMPRAWLSACDPALAGVLANAGLPLVAVTATETGLAELAFSRDLTSGESEALAGAAALLGLMVLRLGRDSGDGGGGKPAARPSIEELDVTGALPLAQEHFRRFGPVPRAEAGRLMFALARCLGRGRCARLVVGGTADETARCLLDWLAT